MRNIQKFSYKEHLRQFTLRRLCRPLRLSPPVVWRSNTSVKDFNPAIHPYWPRVINLFAFRKYRTVAVSFFLISPWNPNCNYHRSISKFPVEAGLHNLNPRLYWCSSIATKSYPIIFTQRWFVCKFGLFFINFILPFSTMNTTKTAATKSGDLITCQQ